MNHFRYSPLSKPVRATLAVAAAFTAVSLLSAVVSLSEPTRAPTQMASKPVQLAATAPR